MDTVIQIVKAAGGIGPVATELGIPYQTVAGWTRRGSIPAAYWPLLIPLVEKRGQTLTLEQLAALARPKRPAGASPLRIASASARPQTLPEQEAGRRRVAAGE